MWDLGVPQQAATILYEDNNTCTLMAMSQKPTPRMRHMDMKYFSLCEWVERDLNKLERVDTSLNMADHFTNQLGTLLFRRHTDYIMGHVPPKYSECVNNVYAALKQGLVKPITVPIHIPTLTSDKNQLDAAAA